MANMDCGMALAHIFWHGALPVPGNYWHTQSLANRRPKPSRTALSQRLHCTSIDAYYVLPLHNRAVFVCSSMSTADDAIALFLLTLL